MPSKTLLYKFPKGGVNPTKGLPTKGDKDGKLKRKEGGKRKERTQTPGSPLKKREATKTEGRRNWGTK